MEKLPIWPHEAHDPFLDFWYCREQWLYYKTRCCVSARHYEKLMTKACGDLLLIVPTLAGRSMPRHVFFEVPARDPSNYC